MLTLVLLVCVSAVLGYPDGAPEEACQTMTPDHFGIPPQESEAPYSLTWVQNPDDDTYYEVSINLLEGQNLEFVGFFIQARRGEATDSFGTFSVLDDVRSKLRPCPADNENGNAITHANAFYRNADMTVGWQPNEGDDLEGVYFVATVVQNGVTFWTNIRSDVLA